jgi:hypothetical protein
MNVLPTCPVCKACPLTSPEQKLCFQCVKSGLNADLCVACKEQCTYGSCSTLCKSCIDMCDNVLNPISALLSAKQTLPQ